MAMISEYDNILSNIPEQIDVVISVDRYRGQSYTRFHLFIYITIYTLADEVFTYSTFIFAFVQFQ